MLRQLNECYNSVMLRSPFYLQRPYSICRSTFFELITFAVFFRLWVNGHTNNVEFASALTTTQSLKVSDLSNAEPIIWV